MDEETPRTEDLVVRARGGSPSALGALFARVDEYVKRRAAHGLGQRLGRSVEPQDLADSALGDALRDLQKFEDRGHGSFRRWLSSILANKARKQARRIVELDGTPLPHPSGSDPGPLIASAPSPATSQASALVRRETIAEVRAALARLPERERILITLRDVENLDWPDVLRLSGELSLGAARGLHSRGMARLTRLLHCEE